MMMMMMMMKMMMMMMMMMKMKMTMMRLTAGTAPQSLKGLRLEHGLHAALASPTQEHSPSHRVLFPIGRPQHLRPFSNQISIRANSLATNYGEAICPTPFYRLARLPTPKRGLLSPLPPYDDRPTPSSTSEAPHVDVQSLCASFQSSCCSSWT
jgi:hypothetical protein